MAGPGGQFNNLMAKMSKTMGGVVSNLGVMWSLLSRDIGKEINKDLAPVINELFGFLKENRAAIAEKISKAIKGIVVAVKSAAQFVYRFRKQLMFIGTMGFLALLGKMTIALGTLGKALFLVGNKGLIAWLKMMAPLVLIGAAVAALVITLESFWRAWAKPEDEGVAKYWLNRLGILEEYRAAIDNIIKSYKEFKSLLFGEDPEKDPMKRGLGFKPKKGVIDEIKEDISGAINFGKRIFSGQFFQPQPSVPQGFGATAPAGFGNIQTPITINVAGSNATPSQIGTAVQGGVKEALRTASKNVNQGVK